MDDVPFFLAFFGVLILFGFLANDGGLTQYVEGQLPAATAESVDATITQSQRELEIENRLLELQREERTLEEELRAITN